MEQRENRFHKIFWSTESGKHVVIEWPIGMTQKEKKIVRQSFLQALNNAVELNTPELLALPAPLLTNNPTE